MTLRALYKSKSFLDQMPFGPKSWQKDIPQDPVTLVVSAISAAATTTAYFTTSFVFSTFARQFLINAAIGFALNALTPRPSLGDAGRGYDVNAVNPAAPHQIIYGETKVGGVVVYTEATDDNLYLHKVIAVAGHEVDSFQKLYLDEWELTLDGDGEVTNATDPDSNTTTRYNGFVRINTHVGTAAQSADSDLVSESDGHWTTDHKLSGIAYIYVRLKYDADVFPTGQPVFTALVRGKKVYDPRTSSTGWSANSALCLRDYLFSGYGLDANASEIDDTLVSTAANICDENVTLAGSGTENRYETNGSFVTSSQPKDILDTLARSMGGLLWFAQGEWRMKAAAWTASVKTFDEDDLRSNIEVSTRHSRRDNFNIVKGTWRGAGSNWQETDYTEVKSSTFITADGGIESSADIRLPMTSSHSMAQRIAKIALYRNRQQLTITADFGLRALGVQVGDVISITNSRLGFSAKTFEVQRWAFAFKETGELIVNMTLRELTQSVFSWSAEETDFETDNTVLPNVFDGLAINNLTASGGGRTTSDGTFINSVILSWTAANNKFVDHYEVEWKAVADSVYNSTTTIENSIEVSPLVDGVQYIIRVRAVGSQGNKGAYSTVLFTGGGDTTAPAVPTSISATGGFKFITIDWTNPADADLNFVEIYENTVDTSSGATLVGISAGSTFTRTNLGLNQTRYYFLKSVDYSGNKSVFTGSGVSATTTYLDDADFENGVRQIFIDAGLDIIEPVSTLPASGDYVNQQVFLTSNNKLYRWTGSAWDEVVASVGANSITATEISDGAISTPKLAANAVTAAKIQADTITGNEIAANTITSGLLATSGLITKVAQISDGIIERAKIKDLAVSTAKIGDNMVTFPQFSQGIQNTNLSISTGAETDAVSLTVNQTGAEAYIQVTLLVSHSDGSVISSSKYGQATIRLYANTTQIASYSGVNNGHLNTNSILLNHTHTATGNTTYKATVTPTGGNDTFYRVVDSTLFFVELKK